MAHWAELDDNNVVLRVVVTDTNDPNGDEGYQWLVENLGGRWIQTSYNTFGRKHLTGGTPLRAFYAGPGFRYDENYDEFYPPSPFVGWNYNFETMEWEPPFPMPTTPGMWSWSNEDQTWVR